MSVNENSWFLWVLHSVSFGFPQKFLQLNIAAEIGSYMKGFYTVITVSNKISPRFVTIRHGLLL